MPGHRERVKRPEKKSHNFSEVTNFGVLKIISDTSIDIHQVKTESESSQISLSKVMSLKTKRTISTISEGRLNVLLDYLESEMKEDDAPRCPHTQLQRERAAQEYRKEVLKGAPVRIWASYKKLDGRLAIVKAAIKTVRGKEIVKRLQARGGGIYK